MTYHDADFIVDCDLVKQILDNIQEDEEQRVRENLIPQFVDNAPLQFVHQLTGDPEGYEKCEQILGEWYATHPFECTIEDAIRLIGQTQLVHALDLLNLKYASEE